MDALPHDEWRVSQMIHYNHSLGPEQWILMNLWFDKYLKGESIDIPKVANSELLVDQEAGTATYTVTPDRAEELTSLDVYYTHDPNPKSRFWIHAKATKKEGTWSTELPVRDHLPLIVFANCRYPLGEEREAFQSKTSEFTMTSDAEVHLPETIDATLLHAEAAPRDVFSDFDSDGFRDWGFGTRGGITTYLFRDSRMAVPGPEEKMKITLTAPRERLSFRFRILKNSYITGVKEPTANYSASMTLPATGRQEVILSASDFREGGETEMADWSNISAFTLEIYDGEAKQNLHFTEEENRNIYSKIEWVR